MLEVVGTDTVTTVSGSLSSGRGVISTGAGIATVSKTVAGMSPAP